MNGLAYMKCNGAQPITFSTSDVAMVTPTAVLPPRITDNLISGGYPPTAMEGTY